MEKILKIVEELQRREDGEISEALGVLLDSYKEKEADLYAANQLIAELLDTIRDSVPKEDVREIIDELKVKRDMNMITNTDIAMWKLNELLEVDYYGKNRIWSA